jgi:hypothetical protein
VAAKKKSSGASYAARVRAFEQAANLGIEAFGASKAAAREARMSAKEYATFARQLIEMARNPNPRMATLRSLASLEDTFFTYGTRRRAATWSGSGPLSPTAGCPSNGTT